MVEMEMRHDSVMLKGKSFDVAYAIEGERVVLYSIQKFGENFGDILDPKAILHIREQLEWVFREESGYEAV